MENLKAAGKIRDYRVIAGKKGEPEKGNGEPKVKIPTPMPDGLLFIVNTLLYKKVPFVREYRFAPPRRFRFDVAIYEKKIYVEYEGLVKSKHNVSGHQSIEGYTKNTDKYNLAASMGWTGYRYTARNYKQFTKDLNNILK